MMLDQTKLKTLTCCLSNCAWVFLTKHTFFCNNFIRDETIWRYIDTISIRWVTIRIAAQDDISRYDPDIRNQGRQCIFTVFSVFDRFKIFLLEKFTFLILNFHYLFYFSTCNTNLKNILFL